MSIPDSVTQILVTLVLVVPGFAFQGVRIRLRGRTPGDTEVTTRILSAIVVSTVFAPVYILALGSSITDPDQLHDDAFDHPRRFAMLGILAAFAIPVGAAYLFTRIGSSVRWERLRTRDKTWYAGLFGGDSYASSWPDAQTIFVEVANKVDKDGEIGDLVASSTGAFIACTDVDYIEFLASSDQEPPGTMETTEVS